MEFVEGETPDNLIKRSGPLEVKCALEITMQVGAGLAAVHKKKLVHRDIKPSNIMVSFEEEGVVTAKIIDLGLAKAIDESGAQSTISASGAFAGTPEFASPEQIVGGEVDIRSDLYSLGVSLWQMLTGHVPFRGYGCRSHVSASARFLAAWETPRHSPSRLSSLIEVLLEKDPRRRFQTPAELLKALPTDNGQCHRRRAYPHVSELAADCPLAIPPTCSWQAGRKTGAGEYFNSADCLSQEAIFLVARRILLSWMHAWANPDVNVVTIVAWAGVGKSTLINHWLRRTAAEHYRSAELVYGWSFYRQGSNGGTSSADEFLDAALTWFGDPDPRIGTAWEKGERLAKLISHRRTLLVLDGLEPLQNPPGTQEGRLRDPSLQALLKELAAFNTGLCVITTRLPVADIADHERTSAPRRDMEHLSSDSGANLLRALGVRGDQAELRSASDEFGGHCLALTLLGSYLTDAYNGDVRCRKDVSEHLSHDVRQGAHARKVMESYQAWFEEGPELSVLRMVGLFDRPTDEKALGALLKSPAIPDLTESLTDLSPSVWRTILAKLRRARLLAAEDPHDPGHLDTHPLIREYFGEQLRSQRTKAWKECNRRLFEYYQTLAPQLPERFSEMEPLFLAVICGCNAGLFREALHEVYIPRIQRGDASFAANVLGVRGALLSALVHFFERGRWEAPVETGIGDHSLAAQDQLFILMQAALHVSVTRGPEAPEVRMCYQRAESLCDSLNRPLLLYVALIGQWRYFLISCKLSAAMQIAKRVYTLWEQQHDPALSIKAYMALAVTLYYLGDFELAYQYAVCGVRVWRSVGVKAQLEEVDPPIIGCLCHKALCEWHLGQITPCHSTIAEAILTAKQLNDLHGLAVALYYAGVLGYIEHNPADVERLASELIELSTGQNIVHFRAPGTGLLGWARSASGRLAQGLPWIEEGIEELRANGAVFPMLPLLLAKAEALHLADRTSEALETVKETEALVESSEARCWSAELHRLRGIFLAAIGADQAEVEELFREAIRTAKQQKSISLMKRAETTYAEYRRQKASALAGHGLRLPLS